MVTVPSAGAPCTVLSVDMGSSSIKVLRGELDDAGLQLAAPRSIAHRPVQRSGYLQWDVEELVLSLVAEESRRAPTGRLAVSLDGWGDGLVFLDRHGRRVGPVRCYLDPGLARGAELVRRHAWAELVAERTGCTIGIDSTLAQLLAVLDEGPAWLSEVAKVVPLVDHLGDLLTGSSTGGSEVSLSPASTSGFLDPRTGLVDRTLLDLLGVPLSWFSEPAPEMRVAGSIDAGRLPPSVQGSVVRVAGHDTATALLADPARAPGRVYVSLGSWAVVGVVVDAARRAAAPFGTLSPVMHEATGDGDLRVNRNVPGLRLVQQLEQDLLGRPATAQERVRLFPEVEPWADAPVVDVFDLDVRSPVTEQVRRWGRRAGRPVETVEQRLREVVRGIAWAIAKGVADLATSGVASSGSPVWICGGGAQVAALVGWVAELTGRPVELGPVAASAVGGVLGTASVLRPDARPAVRTGRHDDAGLGS